MEGLFLADAYRFVQGFRSISFKNGISWFGGCLLPAGVVVPILKIWSLEFGINYLSPA